MNIVRLHAGPRMSQAVIHGNLVFTSGQVADDPSGDVGAQTSDVLRKISRLLKEAGSAEGNILFATVWLADMSDYKAMNAAWDERVVPGTAPARATVEAKLAAPEYLVEIGVIAATS